MKMKYYTFQLRDCSNMGIDPFQLIDNQSTFAQSQVGRELLSDADPAQNLLLSQFTFSLLQDTGYYRITELLPDVNIWGMKKGCDFAINTFTTKSFAITAHRPQACSFDRAGISKCVINQQDQCGYQVITKSCKDSTNQDINYYQQYGYNSICLLTNLTNQPNICLRYNCTDTGELNLTMTNQTVCQLRSQILAPENINFNITCPSNPQTYCSFQNDCPSQCSQRGYCMGGRCTCLWGYSGLGCEQQCSGFRLHDQCIKECPINTFASTDTQYCIGCPSVLFIINLEFVMYAKKDTFKEGDFVTINTLIENNLIITNNLQNICYKLAGFSK
ncbi:hypothetical protein pb186bvf_001467 [Paramecium bursaria]